jgi:hypothetical protein
MTTTYTTLRDWSLRDVLLARSQPAGGLLPGPRSGPEAVDADLAWVLARHDVVRAEQVIDRLSDAGRRATTVAVARAVEQVIDIDLGALVASAWRLHRALVDAARRTLAAPHTQEVVELATHTIGSEHHPYVDLLVDGVRVARIELAITVELTVHAVLAVVRHGRLAEVRAGHGELTASLAAAGVELIARRAEFDLRAHHRFRQPLPLLADAG